MRRHLNYANVIATLALFFAMSGGALAAKHYLINSTKQINPKVIKKLKGNTGPKGATGASGPTGATGATGPQGKEGAPNPSATNSNQLGGVGASHYVTPSSTLTSGDTETGVYGTAGGAGQFAIAPITFIPKLTAAPTGSEYVSSGTTSNCPGKGHAAAGHLCVYAGWMHAVTLDCIGSPEAACGEGPTVEGADVYFNATETASNTTGTWAYTAP
jgi:hypothetical protein